MNKLFIVIVMLGFVLRFFRVESNPPALTWDEVSIGYNAWSIIQTGRDEHQRLFPLDTFIAYGDYKPPVAVYFTVPFVAVFGLTELAVRLPVVLISTLSIVLAYFLVKFVSREHPHSEALSLVTALLLAVSPWHINLSRAGFEAVIGLFFIMLGVYAVISARKGSIVELLQWLPFVAAIYTFNSARYVVVLIAPLLLWFIKEKITTHSYKKIFFGSFLIALLCLLPILPHLLSPEARLRFKEVNIFSDISIVELANERIEHAGNTIWANIINNRRVGYAVAYMKHYLDHFEPSFLFIRGDGNPKFSIQDVGQLYAVEAVFLLVGWYAVFRFRRTLGVLLLGWLLLAIVPAGVARETPHALRILNTLPVWQIVIAFGLVWCWQQIKNSTLRRIFIVVVFGIYSVSIAYYLHTYYQHYPYEFSGEWQYGYKQAIQQTEALLDEYDTVFVSEVIGRPYMYTLFYGGYHPKDFWQTKDSYFDAAGFYTVKGFGKYRFVAAELPETTGKTLYVLPPDQMPEGKRVIQQIRLLNGAEVLRIFD